MCMAQVHLVEWVSATGAIVHTTSNLPLVMALGSPETPTEAATENEKNDDSGRLRMASFNRRRAHSRR
jgi:hypothetical protein